ncbi:MAG: rhodanese-like domain-containing protein [Ideonella sp.]
MKFFIDNWFLFATALVSGGLLLWPLLSRGVGGGKISTSEAVRLINRERAMLLDIRDSAEFASGHPAGARNVPLAALEKSTDLPKNKSLPVVVVCQTGSRASRGVAILHKLGYENAHPLGGGLTAWREASLPVEKAA